MSALECAVLSHRNQGAEDSLSTPPLVGLHSQGLFFCHCQREHGEYMAGAMKT